MTLRHLVGRAYRRLRPFRIPTHPFDLRHGVDTSGLIFLEDAQMVDPNQRHGTAYWGTPPSLFAGVMERWQATLPAISQRVEDYTLIDIGCGKGRVLMLASEFGLRAVAGVELDAALVAVAERNLARWKATPHACSSVSVTHADALAFELPPTPVLLYLFNPFDAHLVQLFLDRLEAFSATRAAPIDVIYGHPAHAALFERVEGMTMLWRGEIPFSAEDTAADAYRGLSQHAILYRLLPPAALPDA